MLSEKRVIAMTQPYFFEVSADHKYIKLWRRSKWTASRFINHEKNLRRQSHHHQSNPSISCPRCSVRCVSSVQLCHCASWSLVPQWWLADTPPAVKWAMTRQRLLKPVKLGLMCRDWLGKRSFIWRGTTNIVRLFHMRLVGMRVWLLIVRRM